MPLSNEITTLGQCLWEQIEDGVFLFDPSDLSVLDANEKAVQWTGRSSDEPLAYRLPELIEVAERVDFQDFVKTSLQGSASCFQRFSFAGGGRLPSEFEVKVASFESEDGQRRGLMMARPASVGPKVAELMRYRSLVDNAPICIHGIDVQGRLSFINPAGLAMLELESDQGIVGAPYLSFVDADRRERVAELMRRAFAGDPSHFEFDCLINNDARRFTSSFIPVTDETGKVSMLMGVTQDATEERVALERLSESQRALRDAQSRAHVGSWEFFPDRDEAVWTEELFRLYYLDPECDTAPGTVEEFIELVHPDDREAVLRRHDCIWNTNDPISSIDLRTNPQRGRIRWLDSSIERVPDPRMPCGFHVAGTVLDITDRKVAETALRDSEQRFRSLCEQSAMGIFLADPDGNCTYVNQSGCELLGMALEQAIGDGWVSALHPDDRYRVTRHWKAAAESDGNFDVECRFLHSDGRLVWVRVRSSWRLNDDDIPLGNVGSMIDITSKKSDQRKLEHSEQRYRNLVEQAPEAIVVLEAATGKFVDFNQKALELFQCDAETLCSTGPWDYCPPVQPDGRLSLESAKEFIAKAMDRQFPVFEWTHRDLRGNDIPCEIRLISLTIDGKTLIRGSITDITDRKKAEQQLRMTRFALESTQESMFVMNHSGRFVDVNSIACSSLGYSRSDLLKMFVTDINPKLPARAWQSHWEEVKRCGRVVYESTHQKSDGRQFPVEISKSYFEFEGEGYAFAFVRDISVRKKVEEELRMTQIAIDQNLASMVQINRDGEFIYVNDAACRHVGYTRAELMTKCLWDIDLNCDADSWPELWRSFVEKRQSQISTDHQKKDGSRRKVEVTVNYFKIENREFLFASAVDVTERLETEDRLKEREAQLAHVSRLSTMGEMVAGIAHELNQPLYSIVNYSKATGNLIKTPSPDLGHVAEWNDQIGQAAHRAGQIIKRLRGFVQRETVGAPTPLHEVIHDALELLRYELNRANIQLTIEDCPGHAFCVDAVQIQQVFVNLFVNAIEAIEQNDSSIREIIVRTMMEEDQIHVVVEDTGFGIPADDRKIFAAFETSKPGGMGLGLAISNSIIEGCGGQLWATGHDRQGAALHFVLPMNRGEGQDV